MKKRLMIAVGVAIVLLTGVPLRGHHSGLTLFSETTSTLKGVVKNWVWSNPHCLLTIEVKGEDGQVVQWVVELQAPNTVYPAGYRANMFKPGDPVAVTLNPVINGRPYGRMVGVVLADGKALGDGTSSSVRNP